MYDTTKYNFRVFVVFVCLFFVFGQFPSTHGKNYVQMLQGNILLHLHC